MICPKWISINKLIPKSVNNLLSNNQKHRLNNHVKIYGVQWNRRNLPQVLKHRCYEIHIWRTKYPHHKSLMIQICTS